MARSPELESLRKRVAALKTAMLPVPTPTGIYSDEQYDRTLAFRVLVHAEIEGYLEAIALAALRAARDAWQQSNTPCTCLMALLAFTTPESKKQAKAKGLTARIELAASWQMDRIEKSNHGIREAHLLQIFRPIGIEVDQLNSTWVNSIDSFGQLRGQAAHRPGRTQQPPDPVSESRRVDDIVDGLDDLDLRVQRLYPETGPGVEPRYRPWVVRLLRLVPFARVR